MFRVIYKTIYYPNEEFRGTSKYFLHRKRNTIWYFNNAILYKFSYICYVTKVIHKGNFTLQKPMASDNLQKVNDY